MRIGLVLALIVAALVTRLLPHPPNFTPILGLSMFIGFVVPSRLWAITAALAVMVLSDLIIGWHGMWAWVYASLALSALVGHYLENRVTHVVSGAVASSALFFILTNFAMWLTGYYGLTFEGLIACYVAAIPFFGNTLASTVLSAAVLFGTYSLVTERFKLSNQVVS